MLGVGIFCIGDDVNIRVFFHNLEELSQIDRMIFVKPEGRHKIVISKSFGVESGVFNIGVRRHIGFVRPASGVMRRNGFTIISN